MACFIALALSIVPFSKCLQICICLLFKCMLFIQVCRRILYIVVSFYFDVIFQHMFINRKPIKALNLHFNIVVILCQYCAFAWCHLVVRFHILLSLPQMRRLGWRWEWGGRAGRILPWLLVPHSAPDLRDVKIGLKIAIKYKQNTPYSINHKSASKPETCRACSLAWLELACQNAC